ncbi:response regulator transcription factor [Chloroflexota bacterium]
MPSRKTSILVVDDDVRILRMMGRILELEGYRVLKASDGETAINVFDEETPNLVLLDILMPGMDGCTVCKRIREFSQIPIIMITAKDSDEEKVVGLDVGADDYVTKPFSASELMARVRAVLRRATLRDEHPELAFCSYDLVIDFAHHRVTLSGHEVNLTATEYRLLSYLACNADRVVTLDQVLGKVWGEDYVGESHLLQVNMARLRQKLNDDTRNPRYILTRPGIGYMMMKQT